MTTVLVSGGMGYIGTTLVPMLQRADYDVKVVDSLWFGDNLGASCRKVIADVRNINKDWLESIDAVIHLAGFSSDPMAEADPMANYVVNAAATAHLAQVTKEMGIRKFVQASSCSVYGFVTGKLLTEEFEPKPQFPYAISKLMAERALLSFADESFTPVILRMGTVGGYSPRMRLDLVINAMTANGIAKKKILVHNPSLWRPLVDVRDVARAFMVALEHEASGIFNVMEANYTVKSMALEVAHTLEEAGFPKPEIEVTKKFDLRSYQADCTKATEVLGFTAEHDIESMVRSIIDNFLPTAGENFIEDSRYYNIRFLKEKGIL